MQKPLKYGRYGIEGRQKGAVKIFYKSCKRALLSGTVLQLDITHKHINLLKHSNTASVFVSHIYHIIESYCQLTFSAILKGFNLIQVIFASAYQNTFLQFNSELLLKNKTLLRNFFHSKPTLKQNARRPVRSFLSQRDSLLQKMSTETYWFYRV